MAGNVDRDIGPDGRTDTMRLRGRTLRCLHGLLLLASMVGTTSVWADGPHNKVKFNLASDEFPKAIIEFYRQSKIEVLFLSKDSLNAIHTQPVIGEYAPSEALDIMLRGTGLVYNFATDHSVSIKQIPPSADPPPLPKKPEHHLAAAPPLVRSDSEEMVTVTGSLIRGVEDVRAPVVDVSQKDLSYAPFPTVQDALYQLPIISLDAPREDLGINKNDNWGAGINLRGLGVGATLVLVNGRRQPLSGFDGDFVDVANIPAAAVDHIEILPQGASATYGSDAIAGVVNIILRDHFDGAQTSVHYGGTAGGRDATVVSQLLGTHWDSGNVMFVYQYSDSTSLPISARGYAASANKAPYGGGNYQGYYADPGNIVDPHTLLPIYGGTGATSSTSPQLSSTINYANPLAGSDLFPQATQHSVYGTGREELGDLELFAEGRFTQRSTYEPLNYQISTVPLGPNNPYNPFPGSTTLVDYSFYKAFGSTLFGDQTRDYVGTLGLRYKFASDWEATLSETYGQEKLYTSEYNVANPSALDAAAQLSSSAAFNPFGVTNPTTLKSIWADLLSDSASGIETTSFVADGSLFQGPAGAVKLATGLERREEFLVHSALDPELSGTTGENARYSRHVDSAFTELSVPLLGDPSNKHAVPRLELTLAGRYDDYSDFGHTTNPEFGIHFAPIDSLKLRASWGRSYRAPKLDDLYDTSNNVSALTVIPDSQSPAGRSLILVTEGSNPDLKPETAKSWTAGFDVVPDLDPEFALSLTYYSIDFTGQIAAPDSADPSTILTSGNEWAAVVTRSPTAAQIAAVCNRSDYIGSVAACLASTPAAIVDDRLANLSSIQTDGLDLNIHQKLSTDVGVFNLGLVGNYVFHFDQEVSSSSPAIDILNTFQNPLKFRFRSTVSWDRHLPEESGLGATLTVNFTNAYRNPNSTLLPEIGSLTTMDLQLRYHTAETAGWLGGMDFALNAINVFNQSPPFADTAYGFDRYNFQSLGRVLGLSVSKKW